ALGEGAVRGIAALGTVSLSAYIGQSVLYLALFPPYTLDLGASLGSAGAAGIALLGWLAMIPPAIVLHRRGLRGPLEMLLRRLAGSPSPRPRPTAPPTPARKRARPSPSTPTPRAGPATGCCGAI